MLAELAAANAAFSVIKQFVSNGKELSGCAKQISDFVFAKEQIENIKIIKGFWEGMYLVFLKILIYQQVII